MTPQTKTHCGCGTSFCCLWSKCKVKLELTYIMIENDGEEIIAIDKLNGVYRVQGEDMLADVTALI